MVKKGPRKVNNFILNRTKKVPLETRLLVEFEFAWYDLFIKTKRFHTAREEMKAIKWAKIMTKRIIKINKDFIQDMLN